MNTTKTVILAARLFLALGVGSAMAQSEVPADAGVVAAGPQTTIVSPRVQAGSSDMGAVRSGAHNLPFSGDFGDLANPG
jgi:hypothetical protein